jgi:hypothetical protein
LVQPSRGKEGASLDKYRFFFKSCAAGQLEVFASMLMACHFLGMLAGRALLGPAAALGMPTRRLTLELIGIEWVSGLRNIDSPCLKASPF